MTSDPNAVDPTVTMQLHAETMQIAKRRTLERVTVKRATTIKRLLVEEPVETEGVLIEHIHAGKYVDSMPEIRIEGDTTIFPIVEEVAVVVKRLFLREEIRITKTRTTARHVETITLREQHAQVTRMPISAELDTDKFPPTLTSPKRIAEMENEETIVAVYDTPAHAELAVSDLRQAKVPESAISRHEGSIAGTAATPAREQGFWSSLFGGNAEDEHVYERSAQSGSSVVVVKTPTHDVDAVMEILERHSPINLDERAASYGATSSAATTAGASDMTTGYDPSTSATAIPPVPAAHADRPVATAATGDTVQLSEEQLVVGKRLVNRGGTRLRRYIVETPVQEDVTLHSETVVVERRPVTGSTVVEPDFSEKTIEMTASAEEAVIGKTAHVVEEVSLRKEASDQVKTVHDTVRKEEVEVEQIPASATVETTTTTAVPVDQRASRN